MDKDRFSILDFKRKKVSGEKITMLTAYDYPMAMIIDKAGIDAILVGDTLNMVVLGRESTVSVTMDEMIHHCKAVRRGTRRAFLIGDMPFMSFQASSEDAVRNAGRFVKEAGCDAVKLEGGREVVERIRSIVTAGIPVLGHIGLTPQSSSKLGGYKVQGKDAETAKRLMTDAADLEKAGCFAVVIECVPRELALKITKHVSIPTIGIGAGNHCDGQVLVTHDMIGLFDGFLPKFVKKYADIGNSIRESICSFKKETETGIFPDDSHSY